MVGRRCSGPRALIGAVWGALFAALAGILMVVPSPAQAARPDVCSGIAGCQVVARVDVTGDGRPDQVGLVRHSPDGAAQGTITVLVRTAAGRRVQDGRRLFYWHGRAWRGTAELDSRPGREIVVGRAMGAHTSQYNALTWRNGRLADLRAPGGGAWVVDGAYSVSLGYGRRPSDPAGLVRRREALRDANGRMQGTVATWRHGPTGWRRASLVRVPGLTDSVAYSWGGWFVPGLPRW